MKSTASAVLPLVALFAFTLNAEAQDEVTSIDSATYEDANAESDLQEAENTCELESEEYRSAASACRPPGCRAALFFCIFTGKHCKYCCETCEYMSCC